MTRIDSHQHFWRFNTKEYGWIDDSMLELKRDFLPGQLAPELKRNGFAGSVSVQARQSVEETRWLLSLAAQHPEVIRGVVGWVPLTSPEVHRELAELAGNPTLKGVRHVLQDEPDDQLLLSRDFNRGVSLLADFHLTYDILIVERQLSSASVFVDRHPNQTFVLDHIAKPKIARHELQPWADHLRELSKRPNVVCKLSGMVTEADHRSWRKEDLLPFMDVALEAFGAQRILFGSDWPVCLLATTYTRWADLIKEHIRTLTPGEQAAILGENAVRIYRL